MKKAQRNKLIFGVVAALLVSFLLIGMMGRNMLSTLHLRFSNFLYFKTQERVLDDIVIVAIDDKAFEIANASELGTLSFDKADYAKVIENLNAAGAKVIGLDVILSEATSTSDKEALVRTLETHDNVILAAEPKTELTTGLKPLPAFADVRPENLGAILFEPDRDNLIRRQYVTFEDQQAPFAFSVQMVKRYLDLLDEDSSQSEASLRLMDFSVRVANKLYDPIEIPMVEGRMLVNFFGPPYSFKQISFADVHGNALDGVELKDKIVLIGEVGTGIHDEQYVPVSFGQAMPGVEIHANAIQTVLSQQFLRNQAFNYERLTIALFVALGMLLFLSLSIVWSIVLLVAGALGYMLVTWVAFEYGLILNTVYPYLALFITLVTAYIYRYFTEAKSLIHTAQAFGRYVSEDVVRQIMDNPGQLRLGGEQKTLTVLFSDIEGFTTISEGMKPTALVTQLNEYLDRMSNVILKHNGTIDKFVGDAIIAFWGAPIAQPKHAERACMAALDYMEALDKLNKEFKAQKLKPFKARIGIHTGKMIVGNVGSHKRFDYTVIGDAVNLGSRLEGKNKDFGTSILISEDTYKIVEKKVEAREIGLVEVKGKKKKVRVYELVGRKKKKK